MREKSISCKYNYKILPPALCLIVVIIALFAQCGCLAIPQKNGTYLSEAGPVVSIDDFDICDGEIYISNDDPGRIQVFDMDGNFLRGYYIPYNGLRYIHADADVLKVYSVKGGIVTELNRDGTIRREYAQAAVLWEEYEDNNVRFNAQGETVKSNNAPIRYVARDNTLYASKNLLGLCAIYNVTDNLLIYQSPPEESIPLFITYLALFACIGWLAVRIAMAAWQKAQLKSEND